MMVMLNIMLNTQDRSGLVARVLAVGFRIKNDTMSKKLTHDLTQYPITLSKKSNSTEE